MKDAITSSNGIPYQSLNVSRATVVVSSSLPLSMIPPSLGVHGIRCLDTTLPRISELTRFLEGKNGY